MWFMEIEKKHLDTISGGDNCCKEKQSKDERMRRLASKAGGWGRLPDEMVLVQSLRK